MDSLNPFMGYRVSSPFGMRKHPIKKIRKFHRGIDLAIEPKNANGPIFAFVGGEVVHTKFGVTGSGIPSEMGIVVAIKAKDGYLHLYAHLSAALVKVGDKIERGQLIGRQGTTGVDSTGKPSSTGNHLHFEVRKKASPSFGYVKADDGVVEPTKYLIELYATEAQEEEVLLKVDDANKIIRFLSAGYFLVEGNKEAQAEFNRLANELRKASGQKEQ